MKHRRVLFMQLSQIRQLIKKFALVILFLIAFVLMMVNKTDTILIDKTSSMATGILSPVVDVLIVPARLVAHVYDYFKDMSLAYEENKFLKKENRKLRLIGEQARALEIENRLLSRILNFTKPPVDKLTTARIVAEEGDAFSHSLIAYIGKNNIVEKGQIVLNEDGVVGRIDKIGNSYAKILLLTDINSRIPVVLEKNRTRAMVAGDNTLNPKLVFLPLSSEVNIGDRIVTSGVAGVFPPGLPVGFVSKIDKREIRIQPYADLNSLEYVKIVSFENVDELNRDVSLDVE